jgi:hypothetical protein
MPTNNPRIQVTLSPATHAAVVAVARARKVPKARVISELLDQAAPVLQEVAKALRLVDSAPERAVAHLARVSGDAVANLLQTGLDLRHKRGRPPKRE